jgi:catechol 2,3-dioxygenase-like lactoylglutathione lyase family enzyme
MTVRRVIVDHVDILVADLEASVGFYTAALAPLGFTLTAYEEAEGYAGFGVDGMDDFGMNRLGPDDSPTTFAHIAFVAESREAVDAFYEAALAAGGTSKIPPALHPEYHATYYGAFVWDFHHNNVEAVNHGRD